MSFVFAAPRAVLLCSVTLCVTLCSFTLCVTRCSVTLCVTLCRYTLWITLCSFTLRTTLRWLGSAPLGFDRLGFPLLDLLAFLPTPRNWVS